MYKVHVNIMDEFPCNHPSTVVHRPGAKSIESESSVIHTTGYLEPTRYEWPTEAYRSSTAIRSMYRPRKTRDKSSCCEPIPNMLGPLYPSYSCSLGGSECSISIPSIRCSIGYTSKHPDNSVMQRKSIPTILSYARANHSTQNTWE